MKNWKAYPAASESTAKGTSPIPNPWRNLLHLAIAGLGGYIAGGQHMFPPAPMICYLILF